MEADPLSSSCHDEGVADSGSVRPVLASASRFIGQIRELTGGSMEVATKTARQLQP